DYFRIADINVHAGFWWWFARVTAGTFIFLVGISLTISHSRSKKLSKFFLRGLKIFFWGLVITLVTYLFVDEEYVRFGILHFIGLSVILGYFFMRFRFINLILGVACLVGGIYLKGLVFSFPWLLWLGLKPENFQTIDYFPLLPWFGVFLLGMFFGKLLYPEGARRFRLRELNNPATKSLGFLGRHSLLIYLIHQPIALGILLALYYDTMSRFLPYL
ncbi:heparan-alpha-glucosaminide N-acetyltransferase, partial [Chloroflexota bacterium]